MYTALIVQLVVYAMASHMKTGLSEQNKIGSVGRKFF